jgi:hypothetical protein
MKLEFPFLNTETKAADAHTFTKHAKFQQMLFACQKPDGNCVL